MRLHHLPRFAAFLLAFLPALRGLAATPTTEGFEPNANGNVYAVATQPDGKIILAGSFTQLQPFGVGLPVTRNHLARFHPDGSLDTSFDPNPNGDVVALAVQPDGKLLIGGRFTGVQPAGTASAYPRTGLARLHADGSVDTSFDPRPGGQVSSQAAVSAILIQSDGRIVIGGAFTQLQPMGSGNAVARARLARLAADGSIDTAFNPAPNNQVLALAQQADGRLLVGGGFTALYPNGSATAVEMKRLARLQADGSVDTSFNVAADNRVLAILTHPSGSITLGGEFLTLNGTGDTTPTARPFLGRVDAAGRVDATFNPVPSASVQTLAFQSDGSVLVGGSFTSLRPANSTTVVSRRYLARLTYAGAVDTAFTATPDAAVAAIAQQADGRIVIGGYFARVAGSGMIGQLPRGRAARLQADGSLDATFASTEMGNVIALAQQSDGSVLLGGSFTAVAGATRHYLARIDASGRLDPAFRPKLNGRVASVALQADGKILIGGEFTQVNDLPRNYIARLNTDGSLDATFDPKANSTVYSLLVLPDGKVIAGGGFTTFQPNGAASTTTMVYLARLNNDGTVDTGFSPTPDGAVYSVVRESDGQLLIAGNFLSLAPNAASTSTYRYYIARLNADGSLDAGFNPTASSTVYTLALQEDGKVLIGGAFTALAPNGSSTTTIRRYLARLNTDGTVDAAFDPNPDGAVFCVLPQRDGTLWVGGAFTTLQPNATGTAVRADRLALVKADGTLAASETLHTNGNVNALLTLKDGAVLASGAFTAAYTASGVVTPAEHHLLRLSSAGAVDGSFTLSASNADGAAVTSLALLRTGGVLAGGTFSDAAGGTAHNLVRLSANGDPDTTFITSTDAAVDAVAVQPEAITTAVQPARLAWLGTDGRPAREFAVGAGSSLSGYLLTSAFQADGKLLVAGDFSHTAGAVGNYLARFHADGTIDTSFNPKPSGIVRAVAVQADGKILVGGSFTTIAATTRNYVARLHADGSLDTAFDPNLNERVDVIRVQADGKILIGGTFTTVQPNGASISTARTYLARLNADGSLDTGYNPTMNGAVLAMVLDGDRAVVGGAFTTVQPNGATSATARAYLARINADGTVDTAFNPTANGTVSALVRQSDAKIVVGGYFSGFQPNDATTFTSRPYIARLNTDGSLDTAYTPAAGGAVSALALASDDSLYVAGYFLRFASSGTTTFVPRSRLVRLNASGALDLAFNPNANDAVYGLTSAAGDGVVAAGAFTRMGTDPVVVVGGAFQQIASTPLPYLARLGTDGSPDMDFRPAPNGPVRALAMHADGRFYAGGEFTVLSGASRGYLARFTAAGALDAGYAPALNGAVRVMVLQPDGRLLIAGDFTQVNGLPRAGLARLNGDGSADAAFNPQVEGGVRALVVLSDSRILVGGTFGRIAGAAFSYLARLHADGTHDATFTPTPDGAVSSLAALADGRVYAGGAFSRIGGAAQRHLARLSSSGALDTTLSVAVDGEVHALLVQEDGRPVIGGRFTQVDGRARYLLARLGSAATSSQALVVAADRSSLTWTRAGTAPNLASVDFEYSSDGTVWSTLGAAGRSGTRWTWSGAAGALPVSTTYYVRAIAILPTNQGGSSGVMDVRWQFFGAQAVGPNASAAAVLDGDTGGSTGGGGSSGGDGDTGGAYVVGAGNTLTPGTVVFNPVTGTGLLNLSTRMRMSAGETVISGFVVTGDRKRTILVRAIGPGLLSYGVNDVVSRPVLELRNAAGERVAEGASWESSPAFATAFAATGAFPLAGGSADAVMLAELEPGAYTALVTNADGTGGVLLTEVYQVGDDGTATFVNISARGLASTGENVLIGGFVIGGTEARWVLIRGLGPALAPFGVSGWLTDPYLRVHDASGQLLVANDNWSGGEITAMTAHVGAGALQGGSRDAAVVLKLAPGAYTAVVTDAAGGTGVGLVEIFDLR